MNRLILKLMTYFLIAFLCFLLVGFLLPWQIIPSSEAVFAREEAFPVNDLSFFNGLPLRLSAPSAPSEASAEPSPVPTAPPFSFETYESEPTVSGETLLIKNSTPYTVDTAALLATPLSFSADQPKVLIVHTHTSEAYAQSEGYAYTPSDPYRTEDPAYNICRVGAALAESLAENGITAICDTESHDYPSYSGCYNRSLQTIEKNLAAHPSIEIVIDLHRDAISASDGSYLKTAAEIDGETAAQVLVIVGTDAGGLSHPDWQKNLTLGLRVQKDLCEMYPGLARPLHLRTERFNGHASPGALLIEIGSNANTMEEALLGARLFGNSLAKTIHSLIA